MRLSKIGILFLVFCSLPGLLVHGLSTRAQAQGIRATLQDDLTSDSDGDGRAESSDVLTYTIVITNTGTIVNGISFSATPDLNTLLVPGSLEISPMAIDDSYVTFRGTDLVVGASDGLMANDFDPDGDMLSISEFDATSTEGALVLVNQTDGSFTYQPPTDYQGMDIFTYGLDDGFGGVVSGTVTISIETPIWFVDNTAPAGGDGSMAAPFDNLADAEMASASGETIFVYRGDGTDQNLDQGIVLKQDQRFLGQGVDLTRGSQVLVPASSPPRISNTSHAVTLAPGVYVAGLSIGSISGSGIVDQVAVADGAEIRDVSITETGEAGIRLASLANMTLEDIVILDSFSAGVDLRSGTGSSTLSDIFIRNASGDGIVIADSTETSISISGIDIMNVTGSGLNIMDASGNFTIDQLLIDGTEQAGLSITNHAGSVTVNNSSIQETLGQALLVEGAAPTVTYNGQIQNGDGHLLSVVNTSGGTVALNNGPFTDVFGLGIQVDNCVGGVSVSSASLNGTQSPSIDLTNSAGVYSFSNTTITDPAAFDGINSQNNMSASTTFTDLNVRTDGSYGILAIQGGLMRVEGSSRVDANQGAALFLDRTELDMRFESLSSVDNPNEGIYLKEIGGLLQVNGPTMVTDSGKSSIRIIDSDGGIDFDSMIIDNMNSNQNGLHVTGTIGSVTTTGGTVNTGMGVPILVDGQGSLTELSMLIESASCNGAANGIVLFDTMGQFTVSGDGTTPSSGGTLEATVGDAVDLKNSENISFNLMNIVDSGQNGIDGTGVEGFALRGCAIIGAGDGVDEDAIAFDDLNQSNLAGTVEILDTQITGMAHHGISIENFSGSVASLLIEDCAITDNRASGFGGSGIRVRANGTSQIAAAQIQDCSLSQLDGAGIIADSGGMSGYIQVTIENNTLTDIDVNAILISPFGSGTGDFSVTGNPEISKIHTDDAVAVSTTAASASVVFSNNPNVDFDPMVFFGNNALFIRQDGDGDLDMTVENNQIINSDFEGIFATARDGLGQLNLLLGGNTVGAPISPFVDGIFVRSQNTNTLCLNLSTADGAGNNDSTGNTSDGYRTSQQDTSTFNLQGFGGGNTTAVETFIEANNTGTASAAGTYGIGTCETP